MKRLFNILTQSLIIIAWTAIMYSCSDNNEAELPPKIILDQENSTYVTKIGKEITITPTYENVQNAVYSWIIDNKVVGQEPYFTYKSDEVKDVYVSLEVKNNAGEAFTELKISVSPLLVPSIYLIIPENGFKIATNSNLRLKPEVEEYNIETTYQWYVNDKLVSDKKDYTFMSETTGKYTLKLETKNEDGADKIEFAVEVCNPEDLPFHWFFETTEYNLSQGRKIRIKIWDIENGLDTKYIWEVNGKKEQESENPDYIFDKKEIGKYNVKVTAQNSNSQLSQELTVNVCSPEGTYKRHISASSAAELNKVYEFMAAPGQFINENHVAETMDQANEYAFQRMYGPNSSYVSLGAWGGYIVVGFDHSIDNDGDYNLQIIGNAFKNSSEPGIVWVMQDENGDGLPNDTWYELKGSEYGKPETKQDYVITYYRPQAPQQPVQWSDNEGNSGTVDYIGAFHHQDYYYPAWVKTPSYKLRGTCLKSKTVQQSSGMWLNQDFEWGYADNFSLIDILTDDDNHEANEFANHFKISNAVTFEGKPANLKYIDFVKVQTGVNDKAGMLGENSTEVFGVNDFNILKKK